MSPRARTLTLLFLLAAAAVCVRLGLWQRDRLAQRRATNAAVAAARALPPVVLGRDTAATLLHRRVLAIGRYDHTRDMLVRGQTRGGVPGVHVVTPLRLEGSDSAVLVNRGFVPAPDAATAAVETWREEGEVRAGGVTLAIATSADGGRPSAGAVTSWSRLDLAALRARLPYPILDVVVLQSPDPGLPPAPRRIEPPALDDGPHLSYMLQWFAFAATAVVVGVVLTVRRAARSSWSTPAAPP